MTATSRKAKPSQRTSLRPPRWCCIAVICTDMNITKCQFRMFSQPSPKNHGTFQNQAASSDTVRKTYRPQQLDPRCNFLLTSIRSETNSNAHREASIRPTSMLLQFSLLPSEVNDIILKGRQRGSVACHCARSRRASMHSSRSLYPAPARSLVPL